MGRHFDNLIELIRNFVEEKGFEGLPNPKRYLSDLVERAELFEFPLDI